MRPINPLRVNLGLVGDVGMRKDFSVCSWLGVVCRICLAMVFVCGMGRALGGRGGPDSEVRIMCCDLRRLTRVAIARHVRVLR